MPSAYHHAERLESLQKRASSRPDSLPWPIARRDYVLVPTSSKYFDSEPWNNLELTL